MIRSTASGTRVSGILPVRGQTGGLTMIRDEQAAGQAASACFHLFETDINVSITERVDQATIAATAIIAFTLQPRKKV